jgi:hypothetical protein
MNQYAANHVSINEANSFSLKEMDDKVLCQSKDTSALHALAG